MRISRVASDEALIGIVIVFGTGFVGEIILFYVVDEHVLGDILDA